MGSIVKLKLTRGSKTKRRQEFGYIKKDFFGSYKKSICHELDKIFMKNAKL